MMINQVQYLYNMQSRFLLLWSNRAFMERRAILLYRQVPHSHTRKKYSR